MSIWECTLFIVCLIIKVTIQMQTSPKKTESLEKHYNIQFLRKPEIGILLAVKNTNFRMCKQNDLHRFADDRFTIWNSDNVTCVARLGLVHKRNFTSGEFYPTVEPNIKAITDIHFYLKQIDFFGCENQTERGIVARLSLITHLTRPFTVSDLHEHMSETEVHEFSRRSQKLREFGLVLVTLCPGHKKKSMYLLTQKARNVVLAWQKITEIIETARAGAQSFIYVRTAKNADHADYY